MDFPTTNKPLLKFAEEFGTNAKAIEQVSAKVSYKPILKAYCFFFSLLLASVFLLIVAIRLAFVIF